MSEQEEIVCSFCWLSSKIHNPSALDIDTIQRHLAEKHNWIIESEFQGMR